MEQRDYKREWIACFKGEVLEEYKEQTLRENIRVLNILSIAVGVFSVSYSIYTLLREGVYASFWGSALSIFVLSVIIGIHVRTRALHRPEVMSRLIAGCYLVWSAFVVIEYVVRGANTDISAYYVLTALGCAFLIRPGYLLFLQFGSAAIVSGCILIFCTPKQAWQMIPQAVSFASASACIAVVVLKYRMSLLKRTEEQEQLLRVKSLYQSIMDETNTGVYVRELGTFNLLYLNKKAREIFGIGEEEIAPEQKCYRLLYHQDVSCMECPARKRNTDSISAREVFLKDHYYEIKGKIIDWDGKEAYVEYLMDITASKKIGRQMRAAYDNLRKKYAEEVLYREKAVSDEILSTSRLNLTQGIVEEMRVGKTDGYEKQCRHITDFAKRILVFCTETWLTKEQNDRLSEKTLLERFEQGDTSFSEEYIVKLAEGRHAWVRAEVKLLRHPETGDIMAFFYNREITRERLLGHVLERIMSFEYDEIYTVDTEKGTYEGIAVGEYAMDEQRQEGDYRKKLGELTERAILPEDEEKLKSEMSIERIHDQLQQEQTHLLEVTLLSKNGKARRKQIRCMYLYREVGTVLVTITDIDDVAKAEKEKQEQLERALCMAKEASRAKSSFLASMSHEIRTPMNAIIGLNVIIKEEIDHREQVLDCCEKLDSASRYLLALLNDVLDMSRIESGNMSLAHQPFESDKLWDNVNILARAQADMASVRYLFERNKQASGRYRGDETRLQQIMVNLINNAIKFTAADGYVKVSVEEQQETRDRVRLCVQVEDNGIGISKEFLPEVFGTFTQQHDGSTTEYKGSGLGLSIARNFARMMGGDIEVTSREGVGTTFAVTVFLEADGMETLEELAEEEVVERDFTAKKILLVEDHPLNTIVAKRLLEKRGFAVVDAKNGKEAVECFQRSEPGTFDAVLMDIRMPVMDGIEAAVRIRGLEREDAKCVPIIAMTANAYEEDRRRTAEAGMNAHLAKPIDPNQLFKTLDDFI